jgi:hypothetical protein
MYYLMPFKRRAVAVLVSVQMLKAVRNVSGVFCMF